MDSSNPSNHLFTRALSRNEAVALFFRLTLVGAVTYFSFKWAMELLDPTRKQKLQAKKEAEVMMKRIGIKCNSLTDYELCIASHLVDPLSLTVSWKDIGGLEDAIDEIKSTIILPLKRRELFKNSRLLQPPKGVLLYGPPGCGKTMIAKATAKAANARFINLQLTALIDKWYGESQKLCAAVFSLAHKLEPSIIFIDEIDSFLRSRESSDHECTAMMKAQFMSLWDGLITDSDAQVIVMGATNRPHDVDRAILRRMPAMFFVGPPSVVERRNILDIILTHERLHGNVNLDKMAELTPGFSGSDLKEMCRVAAVHSIQDIDEEDVDSDVASISSKSICTADLMAALTKMNTSNMFQAANDFNHFGNTNFRGVSHPPPNVDLD